MAAITVYSGISGNPGSVDIAAGTTSRSREVETALPGRGVSRTQDLTNTAEDIDLADVDVTKEHIVWLRNLAAEADTNYVELAVMSDGSTTTYFGRARPGDPIGPIIMMPQTAGYPKLRVRMNTGTGRIETKVAEVGDPAA